MMSRGRIQLLIVTIAALLFIPGLGAVHLFDWDEINFAEIAREMLVTGDWSRPQIDYQPFHEKPPLFIWFQALSMTVFGVGEFAARLPNAICGMVTLLVLFRIGSRERGTSFGLLWALAYIGSILPHLYFRSGIIDPWFNLFIFLGLDRIIVARRQDTSPLPQGLMAGVFLGLAVLTKGPVGLLIPSLAIGVFWALERFRPILRWKTIIGVIISFFVTTGVWALYDLVQHGPVFMEAFFWRQVAMLTTEDAGHGGFFGYHFVVLLLGCFPASVFALQELVKPSRSLAREQAVYRKWMVILFWVVLILFSIVKTKIVHYSSLCYFPLTFLAAMQLQRIWEKREAFGWSRIMVGVVGMLFVLITLALPFLGMNIELIKPFFAQDAFALANLDAEVEWNYLACIAGSVLLATLIVGLVMHRNGRVRAAIVALFGGTALFVWSALNFFINRIEGYSQRAAIEFFEERQGEECYVITSGYKSYAQLFYTRKPLITDPHAYDEEWLLKGEVDRPVFVVCKVTRADEVAAIPALKEMYRKNGFVFFERSQ